MPPAGDHEVEQKRLAALEDITGDEESVLDHEDLAVPMFGLPVLPPIEPVTFNDETPVLSDAEIAFPAGPVPEGLEEEEAPAREPAGGFWASSRNRLIVASIAGLVVAGAVSAAVITQGSKPAPRKVVRVAAAPVPVITDSARAAGTAAAAATPMTFTVDSGTARAWLDSLKHEHPVDVSWAIDMARVKIERAARARAIAARDSARASRGGNAGAAGSSAAGADGILSQPAGVRAVPRDSARARRDSTARPDSSTPPSA